MQVSRAVITAAGPNQRHLPVQTLVDQDGETRSLLAIVVRSALQAKVEEVCVVVCPDDEDRYAAALGPLANHVVFVAQPSPRGYGDAVLRAKDFVSGEPFLHLISDHVFISTTERSWVEQVVATARQHQCSVSAVVPTRETLLPYFGAVAGRRVPGTDDLFEIDRVAEKPTPTEAERELVVPGLRAGHYLCFSGLHILTPTVMEYLEELARTTPHGQQVELSPALDKLARSERYLALHAKGLRYAVDTKYGLLTAQLALALSGPDRNEVLTQLVLTLADLGFEKA